MAGSPILAPIQIPTELLPFFEAAGWYASRRVQLPDALRSTTPAGHPAREILESLWGLHVGTSGSGIECATSDLDFLWLAEDAEFAEPWQVLLGTRLIEVAEVQHGHGTLYAATDGRCFGRSMFDDAFYFEGPSFGAALDGLLRGRRARPMLRLDQDVVWLYGIPFTRSSPELYGE